MAVSMSTAPTPSGAPTPAPPSNSSTPSLTLPPPHIFDILPPLHEILARIDHGDNKSDKTDNNSSNPTRNLPSNGAISHNEPVVARYPESQPLDPKDLPNEVLALKARIRRALKELEKLPDMDRSCEEQVEEIRELEDRKSAQEALMARLALVAAEMQALAG